MTSRSSTSSCMSSSRTSRRVKVEEELSLKARVGCCLKKVGDRDTHQMGSDELQRIAETLSPEGLIGTFLSCIVVSDGEIEKKPAVSRECVRLISVLVRSHPQHILHLKNHLLSKMVNNIVRRLRDSDSLVRDACVDTCGVIASSSSSSSFPVLVDEMLTRPLFQALVGEQSRYVQAGSALCLARVIQTFHCEHYDSGSNSAVVPAQMLPRLLKLLKNPHFVAKPPIIHLITTVLQAGGAPTEHAMSAALNAILEALKSTDWTTRKAAAVALAAIATAGRRSPYPLTTSFKTSCITSLETSRFDKVKPVRDAILHALQCWKSLPGTHSPQPSEAGSSTKENITVGDYHDSSSAGAGAGGWRHTSFMRSLSAHSANSPSPSKKRAPLTVRRERTCPTSAQNRQHLPPNDWHIKMSLPETHSLPFLVSQQESDGSCTTKTFSRNEDRNGVQDIKYGYDRIVDDKPGCSSISDLASGNFETKHVAHDSLDQADSANLILNNHGSVTEEIDSEGVRSHDRKSLDSTVTDLSSHGMRACCLHASDEMAFIKKQLLEIETKQSNLLDLLQVFMGNSVDNLSSLQLKFHNLEHAVDKIVRGISQNANCPSRKTSNTLKKNQTKAASPRLSTSTPRPSVDSNHRQPSLLPLSTKEIWDENSFTKGRSSTSLKEDVELWRDPTLNMIRNPIARGSQKSSGRSVQNSGSIQRKETRNLVPISACNNSANQCNLESKRAFWQKIKGHLCAGDIESAYIEVLCSGDDLILFELMDRTGPVLERLSDETADVIISMLTTHFRNQRFTDAIFPWFQQVVDLSSARKPGHVILSSKTEIDLLFALREVAAIEYIDPVDRRSIAECATKLSQVWGELRSRTSR